MEDIQQEFKSLLKKILELINCDNFGGWFVGDFKPALINSQNIEFGYKRIPKNTKPDYHFHKFKTEYTILLEGKIICLESENIIKPITCIKLLPFEKNDQFFIEDSLIFIINTPSKKNDKHF